MGLCYKDCSNLVVVYFSLTNVTVEQVRNQVLNTLLFLLVVVLLSWFLKFIVFIYVVISSYTRWLFPATNLSDLIYVVLLVSFVVKVVVGSIYI